MKYPKFLNIITCILFMLMLLSCGRAKKKGHEIINQSKKTLSKKKEDVEDKIIPKFDAYSSDTRFNKQRFFEFFGFEPSDDVKNLFCYADLMGIDSKFQFSFNCEDSTLERIVTSEHLSKISSADNYSFNSLLDPTEFAWWKNEDIEILLPYWKNENNQIYS